MNDDTTKWLLLQAGQQNVEALREALNNVSANSQDPETGNTALHSAILGAARRTSGQDQTSQAVDGSVDDGEATVQLLLENGAIWNDLNKMNETPGCLARRLGLHNLYEILVQAGVRAELLLSRLDEYPIWNQDVEDVDENAESASTSSSDENAMQHGAANATLADSIGKMDQLSTIDGPLANQAYLSSSLSFSRDNILDSEANGVMMAWEGSLMQRTASQLLDKPGLRVLNIGFGMGIFDSCVATHTPKVHHIVEAHPAILERMREQGWLTRQGVTVHEGTWQDILPRLVAEDLTFDAIFFDTFAESYSDFRTFFSEFAIALLESSGKWSFFHGLGADRQISYDVYSQVCEYDLNDAGFQVEWEMVALPELKGTAGALQWQGVRRKYFDIDQYRLPICKFLG